MAMASGVALSLYPEHMMARDEKTSIAALLFGEAQARYLLAVPSTTWGKMLKTSLAEDALFDIGAFGKKIERDDEEPMFGILSGSMDCAISLSALRAAYEGWLPKYMSGEG
jgi:hypothetical protein